MPAVTPVLETARLRARPLEPRDVAPIHAALQDWEVARWLAVVPWPYAVADAEWFVAATRPGGDLADEWTFAVEDRATGAFQGVIGLGDQFGYWLAREAWGRRCVPEVGAAVLAAHGPGPVPSGYFAGNERSRRVLEGFGFRETARNRKFCRPRGEDVDHVVMVRP